MCFQAHIEMVSMFPSCYCMLFVKTSRFKIIEINLYFYKGRKNFPPKLSNSLLIQKMKIPRPNLESSHAEFLFGLLCGSVDGGDIFLRNVERSPKLQGATTQKSVMPNIFIHVTEKAGILRSTRGMSRGSTSRSVC